MIKEVIVGLKKCNKIQIKILYDTSDDKREKILNDIKSEYKNVFIVRSEGDREVIKGCENVDINNIDVDFNEIPIF